VLHTHPIHLEREATDADPLAVEIAIQYNDGYNEIVHSFANNINTVDGEAYDRLSSGAHPDYSTTTPNRRAVQEGDEKLAPEECS